MKALMATEGNAVPQPDASDVEQPFGCLSDLVASFDCLAPCLLYDRSEDEHALLVASDLAELSAAVTRGMTTTTLDKARQAIADILDLLDFAIVHLTDDRNVTWTQGDFARR